MSLRRYRLDEGHDEAILVYNYFNIELIFESKEFLICTNPIDDPRGYLIYDMHNERG